MLLNASTLNTLVIDEGGLGSGASGHGGTPGSARFISDSELARLLTSAGYNVAARVRIADPSGVVWDYSNRDEINWIHSISYAGSIDNNVSTATVKLWREVGGRSLAPFRSSSSYNQIPFVAADSTLGTGPSIDAGRRITIDVATVDLGIVPTDADYHTVFDGYIDVVDWSQPVIELDCRDLAASLADTWFTVPGVIGVFPIGPLPIIGVIGTLLAVAHTDVAIQVAVPSPPVPDAIITAFRWDIGQVITVLTSVADTIGWDLRMRWSDADQAFRFTFRDPGRDRTDADWTIPPSSYYDFSEYRIDRTNIRNDITLWYGPAVSRASVNAFSLDSIQRYGRKSMVIQDGSDSSIQTVADAVTLVELILSDLGEPEADAIFEMPFFWPPDLNDIIKLPANLVHSDTDKQYAIVAYKHTLDGGLTGKSRSEWTLRGKPGSGYYRWFARKPITGDGTSPVEPPGTPGPGGGFASLSQTPNYATDHVEFDWVWTGDAGATFDVYVQLGSSGFSPATTVGPSVFTYDYTVGADIEPFHTPPDPPQLPLNVAFYLIAKVSGVVAAQSLACSVDYGDGP